MVAAVGIQAPQGNVLVAVRQTAENERVPQFGALVAYNIPALGLKGAQGGVYAAIREESPIASSQANVLAAVRGRAANPRIRAWTFTLDGHDFYVLRLGDRETLIYDLSTEQWMTWASGDLSFWRPNTGIAWTGAHALGQTYGSNIVAGDDTWGLLWFLDPKQPYDDHPDASNPSQELEFDRVVMGQVVERGREVTPCDTIFLVGDNYGFSGTEFTPTITLEYSDDGGKTFNSADTISVTLDPSYSWRSLGQITSPGRLFKITDNGVFTRIDDMKMNDG